MDVRDLVCPFCTGDLTGADGSELRCLPCARSFPIVAGIPSFAPSIPGYVQERFTGQHQRVARSTAWGVPRDAAAKARRALERSAAGRKLLYGLLYHRFRIDAFIQRALAGLPEGSLILDLGCGPGDDRYCRYGEVVGLDASLWVLQHSQARSYSLAVHGNALKLPFRAAQFDCVITRAFYGHIPMESKDELLSGIARVLKPGGRYVVDIESGSSGAHRLLKSRPDLQPSFMEKHYGVWGFEEPPAALSRLSELGLRPARTEKLWGWVWDTDTYLKWWDNEYAAASLALRWWVPVCRFLSKSRALEIPADVLLGLFSRAENLLIDDRDAVEMMVVAERSGGAPGAEPARASRRMAV